MTIEEIQELIVEDVKLHLKFRILETMNVNISDPSIVEEYQFNTQELEDELTLYKQELTNALESRLAEIARIEDLKERINLLNDSNASHYKLNPAIPNKDLWFKQKIMEAKAVSAEANMKALEATDLLIVIERQAVEYKDLRIKEYPPIQDQLDEIYHNGLESWKAKIKIIKDKYPKPE